MNDSTINLMITTASNGKDASAFLRDKLRYFENRENVKVKVKFVSWNRLLTNIIKSFKEGNSPDVFQLGTTWIETMAYLGYIAPLSYDIKKNPSLNYWMDEYCSYQGKKVAVPWLADTIIMSARSDILDEFNIKNEDLQDWDGFYQVCKKLVDERKRNNKIPFFLPFNVRPDMDTVHRFLAWVFAGDWNFPELNPVPEKIFAVDNIMSYLNYLSKLIDINDLRLNDIDKHPYLINEDYYKNNSYVFYIGHWYGVIGQLVEESNSANLYKVLPIPAKTSRFSTYGGGSVLSVSSRTDYPIKAQKLIEYIVSENFADEWLNFTGGVPAFECKFWRRRDSSEQINTLYELTRNSKTYPQHPLWTSIESVLQKEISNCLWHIFEEKRSEIRILNQLKKLDRDIIQLLKLCWEMNCDEI
ncbi:MAG: extracellular solute-binding protein [Halothermotrichaceae bacterium]